MDKLTLIKYCQLGDMSSFSELYKLYSKQALGTAYLIAGQKSLAEDIVHEAFIQCFQHIKTLKNIETFDVWFYKILTRTGWRVISKYKSSIPLDEVDTESDMADLNAKAELNFYEDRLVIYDALSKLTPPLRTVIVLHYFNDMTIKDISKVLGCFEGTIKSRLFNAKKQLRQLLNEDVRNISIKSSYIGKESLDHGK